MSKKKQNTDCLLAEIATNIRKRHDNKKKELEFSFERYNDNTATPAERMRDTLNSWKLLGFKFDQWGSCKTATANDLSQCHTYCMAYTYIYAKAQYLDSHGDGTAKWDARCNLRVFAKCLAIAAESRGIDSTGIIFATDVYAEVADKILERLSLNVDSSTLDFPELDNFLSMFEANEIGPETRSRVEEGLRQLDRLFLKLETECPLRKKIIIERGAGKQQFNDAKGIRKVEDAYQNPDVPQSISKGSWTKLKKMLGVKNPELLSLIKYCAEYISISAENVAIYELVFIGFEK